MNLKIHLAKICLIPLWVFMTFATCAQDIFPELSSTIEAKKQFTIGFYHENKGELDLAKKHYQEAIELDTNFALAYLASAMIEAVVSDRRRGLEKAMSKLSFAKTEYERLWIKGRNAVYGNGKAEEEFVLFEEMARLYPNNAMSNYLLGFVYQHHGRNDHQKAITYFQKAVKMHPGFSPALNELAYAFMETKQFDEAQKILLQNIELIPDKPNPYDSYAEYLLRMGKYEASIAYYDKVLQIDKNFPWAYIGQAANLNFLGRFFEARKVLGQLAAFNLSEREAWHQMQAFECSYIAEGKLDSAILILDTFAEKAKIKGHFTQQYIAHRNKTRIYFEHGDHSNGMAAYQAFNQMVSQQSKNEATKKQVLRLGLYYQAYQAFFQGNLVEAMQLLKQYETLMASQDDYSRMLWAKIFAKQNLHHQAIEILEKANELNPSVQVLKAEMYKNIGEKAKAELLLNEVLQKNQMQDLEYHLARNKALSLYRALRS